MCNQYDNTKNIKHIYNLNKRLTEIENKIHLKNLSAILKDYSEYYALVFIIGLTLIATLLIIVHYLLLFNYRINNIERKIYKTQNRKISHV